MRFYRLTPHKGAPVLRCAANAQRATARGLLEFPAGLLAVEEVSLQELASLAAEGLPIPVAARHRLEVHKATQRERAKADARIEAMRDRAREKARDRVEQERAKLRAQREEEAAQQAALKAQQKAEAAAEKRRKTLADRRAQRRAGKLQQAGQQSEGPPTLVDTADPRLPWED